VRSFSAELLSTPLSTLHILSAMPEIHAMDLDREELNGARLCWVSSSIDEHTRLAFSCGAMMAWSLGIADGDHDVHGFVYTGESPDLTGLTNLVSKNFLPGNVAEFSVSQTSGFLKWQRNTPLLKDASGGYRCALSFR
jgi:hypothetical protein